MNRRNNMKFYRIPTLIIAASLLLSSCGGTAVETSEDTTASEVTSAANAEEALIPHGIPDDVRFDGETLRLYTMEGYFGENPEDYNPDRAEVVYQANYDRTVNVEERLGVDIQIINTDYYQEMPDMIRQSVSAGSNDYDIVFCCASYLNPLVMEGNFLTLDELPYVDLEKPWWNKDYISSVSFNPDNAYILFGDINWNNIERTTCTFFNMRMMEDVIGVSTDEIYDIVLNGDWTIDKMYELQSEAYNDKNGNTKSDPDDNFGFIHTGNWSFSYMAYGAGLEFTSRDEEGYPVLDINKETTVDLIDKLGQLFFGNEDALFMSDIQAAASIFGNGQALFFVNRLFMASWDQFRNMKDDYGIIPVPKFSAEQDGYHAVVEQLTQWGCVPTTVENTDMVSAAAELLAYEGYNEVTPAYYDVTLKFKYSRGDDVDSASKIIDMIVSGARCDFLYINTLGGMGNIFEYVYNSGQNTFASQYASMKSVADSELYVLKVKDRKLHAAE